MGEAKVFAVIGCINVVLYYRICYLEQHLWVKHVKLKSSLLLAALMIPR